MAGLTMDSLLVLQKLAEMQKEKKRQDDFKDRGSTANAASYKDVWEQVRREQEEWNKTLDEVDITQYKLALMDSFWSDRHDALSADWQGAIGSAADLGDGQYPEYAAPFALGGIIDKNSSSCDELFLLYGITVFVIIL